MIPVEFYDDVLLGYASTTHRGQGASVEQNVYVLAGGPMQDKQLSYVQLSRARGETKLFIDASEAGEQLTQLARAMAVDHRSDLAHDQISAMDFGVTLGGSVGR